MAFLPRHGRDHTLPPHRVPYRANAWALWHLGVRALFAPGVAARTLAVWLIFASVLMCVYLLSGWILQRA